MDYELRIIVEKVARSSQDVITRDTITSYALQCPTSIVELRFNRTNVPKPSHHFDHSLPDTFASHFVINT